jgi:hypothetical protein
MGSYLCGGINFSGFFFDYAALGSRVFLSADSEKLEMRE